jgi:hypothetical protein
MKRVLLQLMLLIGVVIGSVSVAAAQWTSVGSAGTVDEADLAIFDTTGAQVRIIAGSGVPASVVVRYNVVNIPGIAGEGTAMTVRFRDNGAGARVLAILKQVSFTTGMTTNVFTIDSNTFPSSADFQNQSEFSCDFGFDFNDNAYYIEATLTRSSEAAAPALQLLRIGLRIC